MNINTYTVPILFVIFNRKDIASEAFQKIREIKPQKLYIAGDGARENIFEDTEKVKLTRIAILEMIDWECDLKTLFSETNLGCGVGVSRAIEWFFQNEEAGIILEDDCVVQTSFFYFMDEMLRRYKDDDRIGMISGYNAFNTIGNDYSYCFSKYKSCWGWATWRRAWDKMDLLLSWRGTESESMILNNMGYNGKDIRSWRYKLKKIDANKVSAWDWQWYFSLASQNLLCIFPAINQVSNIGFGQDATHTSNINSASSMELQFPLKHPKYVVSNDKLDNLFYKSENSIIRRIRTYFPISFNARAKKLMNILKINK